VNLCSRSSPYSLNMWQSYCQRHKQQRQLPNTILWRWNKFAVY